MLEMWRTAYCMLSSFTHYATINISNSNAMAFRPEPAATDTRIKMHWVDGVILENKNKRIRLKFSNNKQKTN